MNVEIGLSDGKTITVDADPLKEIEKFAYDYEYSVNGLEKYALPILNRVLCTKKMIQNSHIVSKGMEASMMKGPCIYFITDPATRKKFEEENRLEDFNRIKAKVVKANKSMDLVMEKVAKIMGREFHPSTIQ